jgi:aryl-alcohol dehydrogenase-like predicted oxidoreductase
MKYKTLGNTGLKVSEICLGAMTFGGNGIYKAIGELGQAEADELVRLSVDSGVNFFDTANVYSAGQSEEILGQSLINLGIPRDSMVIATKVRAPMGGGPNDSGLSRKHILQQVEASLRRLKTDYIDLYQTHSYDPETPIEETLQTLDHLVRSGKVRYIGASNLTAWQLMKELAVSARNGWEQFVSLQAYYSLAGRDIERELIPLLQDQRLGLMVYSPLAAGMLTGKYTRENEGRAGGRRDKSSFLQVDKERAYKIITLLHPMAAAKNATLAQLSLAWLLYQPAVTSIIAGARTLAQLRDNLKATDIQFTDGELKQLAEVSALPVEYPGWIQGYRSPKD